MCGCLGVARQVVSATRMDATLPLGVMDADGKRVSLLKLLEGPREQIEVHESNPCYELAKQHVGGCDALGWVSSSDDSEGSVCSLVGAAAEEFRARVRAELLEIAGHGHGQGLVVRLTSNGKGMMTAAPLVAKEVAELVFQPARKSLAWLMAGSTQ